MLNLASSCVGSGIRGVWNTKNQSVNVDVDVDEIAAESDDEISSHSSCGGEDEGLECPICWEYFNIVENVPYVLWCGHSVCKNCILGLQWGSIIKFPSLPLQLPLFISCPWCNFLSPRLVYKGNLKIPSKNYFLLSMVESRNGERVMKSHSSSFFCCENYCPPLSNRTMTEYIDYSESLAVEAMIDDEHMSVHNLVRLLQYFARKCVDLFVELMTKFPLVVIFMVIVLYAVPASATILALYAVITVLFAVPSFLVLYFAYPSLDWLVKEIIT